MEEKVAPILVVDDEQDMPALIQMKFRRQIRNNELCFFFASNGKEALDVLHEHPEINVVLADINMPVMDGLTMLSEIYQNSNIGQTFQFVKVIVITAYNDMTNIRRAMNYGAFDFLTKPLDFEDLVLTVRKTLYEVGKLRELDQKYKEELKKRLTTEEALGSIDPAKLQEVLEKHIQ
jgi:CheY-like chemotaxis protein